MSLFRGLFFPRNTRNRLFTSSSLLWKGNTASFDDVKTVQNKQNTILIDVREPTELKQTGVIPGSINIPLKDVEKTLRDLPPEQFKKKYGRPKPEASSTIIFSCKSGKRAAQAQDIATKLGFKNAVRYEGSWTEWEKKTKTP